MCKAGVQGLFLSLQTLSNQQSHFMPNPKISVSEIAFFKKPVLNFILVQFFFTFWLELKRIKPFHDEFSSHGEEMCFIANLFKPQQEIYTQKITLY